MSEFECDSASPVSSFVTQESASVVRHAYSATRAAASFSAIDPEVTGRRAKSGHAPEFHAFVTYLAENEIYRRRDAGSASTGCNSALPREDPVELALILAQGDAPSTRIELIVSQSGREAIHSCSFHLRQSAAEAVGRATLLEAVHALALQRRVECVLERADSTRTTVAPHPLSRPASIRE